MLDIVRRPESMVKGPRPAEFEGKLLFWRLIARRLYVGDWPGRHPLEDVPRFTATHQRLPEDQEDRVFCKLLQVSITEVGDLRFVVAPRESEARNRTLQSPSYFDPNAVNPLNGDVNSALASVCSDTLDKLDDLYTAVARNNVFL